MLEISINRNYLPLIASLPTHEYKQIHTKCINTFSKIEWNHSKWQFKLIACSFNCEVHRTVAKTVWYSTLPLWGHRLTPLSVRIHININITAHTFLLHWMRPICRSLQKLQWMWLIWFYRVLSIWNKEASDFFYFYFLFLHYAHYGCRKKEEAADLYTFHLLFQWISNRRPPLPKRITSK